MPTRQRIKSELIDLKDDVKFELSELNNQKNWLSMDRRLN